jgi:peptidoglycan hydrolase CwlO-like protein
MDFSQCVNDVTNFQNHITVYRIMGHNFAPGNKSIDKINMKTTIFTLAATLLITGTLFTGCQSSADKVENANEKVDEAIDNVAVAQQELNQAIRDSIQQFKKESEEKINAYEQNIAEFKAKIAKEKNEARIRDERRLAELEQQNREMKQRLADFKEESSDQWISFRTRFNRDMEEHGRAFRDFWGVRK